MKRMEAATGERHQLELVDSRHKKLSGTSLMLRDFECRYIYKIIPEYTTSEATFYAMVNGQETFDTSRNYDYLKDTLKEPALLAELNVLPRFYGVVKVIQEECPLSYGEGSDGGGNEVKYYEGSTTTSYSTSIYTAIKLENVLYNYDQAAIIDIKLGGHNTLDNANYGGLSASRRIACVRRWQELKMRHKLEQNIHTGSKRLYNITANDLGLGDPFIDMTPTELDALLKSWRQKFVASQTTEDDLGFRICSICILSAGGPLEVSASQAKLLKREDTLSILNEVFSTLPEVRKCMMDVLVKLRTWIELQDELSFSATSLLATYDQKDPSRCTVNWVDFTHVESIRHSRFSVCSGPSNMIKGIDQLISICKNLD